MDLKPLKLSEIELFGNLFTTKLVSLSECPTVATNGIGVSLAKSSGIRILLSSWIRMMHTKVGRSSERRIAIT